jgi:hypothetical protein
MIIFSLPECTARLHQPPTLNLHLYKRCIEDDVSDFSVFLRSALAHTTHTHWKTPGKCARTLFTAKFEQLKTARDHRDKTEPRKTTSIRSGGFSTGEFHVSRDPQTKFTSTRGLTEIPRFPIPLNSDPATASFTHI